MHAACHVVRMHASVMRTKLYIIQPQAGIPQRNTYFKRCCKQMAWNACVQSCLPTKRYCMQKYAVGRFSGYSFDPHLEHTAYLYFILPFCYTLRNLRSSFVSFDINERFSSSNTWNVYCDVLQASRAH